MQYLIDFWQKQAHPLGKLLYTERNPRDYIQAKKFAAPLNQLYSYQPQSGNDADSCIVLEPVSTDVYRIRLKNYNLCLTAITLLGRPPPSRRGPSCCK